MTKFVLHGGYTGKNCENNREFFLEMLKGFNNPRILLTYFSRPKEKWNELFDEDKKNFNFKGKFLMANAKNFSEQIKKSDIIYLRGGDTYLLLKGLKKINFKDLIRNKVVGGSSAGVYVLVKYYNNDTDKFQRGLGILNVKAFCHFSQDKKDKLKMLKEYKENLKTYVLRDTEFIVLEEHF